MDQSSIFVAGIDLGSLVAELRQSEPGALAVLLFGSQARGTAHPGSDIDLRVVTAGAPRERDRVRFLDGVHLSIGSRSVADVYWHPKSRST